MPLIVIDKTVYEISYRQLGEISKRRKEVKYKAGGPYGEGSGFDGKDELMSYIDNHISDYKKIGNVAFEDTDF